MHNTGAANKTIKSHVSAVSAMLRWCERKQLVRLNPLRDLDLKDYGKPSQRYQPFEKDQLHKIFARPMPAQDRLVMSLLITTGMRLDEAALLTWERIKETDGIRYVSLMDQGEETTVVKNTASKRLIALPDCLELPARGTGRLFDYRIDADGKAERAASKALMKTIRQVTTERRKAVHSLRGNLKDLLRDAGVSKETNDFITGHSQQDEASKYGNGPSLEAKYKAVNLVAHPWLQQGKKGN